MLFHRPYFLLTVYAYIHLCISAPFQGEKRAEDGDKLVFAHLVIGTLSGRTSPNDYDNDMQKAKAVGIDAFALNIGTEAASSKQLDLAYQSAENNGMKVFISFDCDYWNVGDQASQIGSAIKSYSERPSQLLIGNKVFVSTFGGDGMNVQTIRDAAGVDILFAPNLDPSSYNGAADGLLSWRAWPNNGGPAPPDGTHNYTTASGDYVYDLALNGKPYVAPVSPWFFTHFGQESTYAKNWVFGSDLLWYNRWNEILGLGPQYVEIITWNDYGESHYVGPLSSLHEDDGASKWVNDMPHTGWLTMAGPYIAAYKAGSKYVAPFITSDSLTYWYRPTPKDVECDNTDNCELPSPTTNPTYFIGKPNGWDAFADSVFVVAMLTAPGEVMITSGSNSQTFNAQAGANAFEVPMGVGPQSFALTRNGKTLMSGTSAKDIVASCVCGIYNFNAYVGSLPNQGRDSLQPGDAYKSFGAGMNVQTCMPQPSLAA